MVAEGTQFGAIATGDVEVYAAQQTAIAVVEGEGDGSGTAQETAAQFAGQEGAQGVVTDVAPARAASAMVTLSTSIHGYWPTPSR